MIKHDDPNLLNIHGLREPPFCPPHFTKVTTDLVIMRLRNWVYENLDGRFYIKTKPNTNQVDFVAFENASEASYFALLQDSIPRFD